jgi:hypothetical protein
MIKIQEIIHETRHYFKDIFLNRLAEQSAKSLEHVLGS